DRTSTCLAEVTSRNLPPVLALDRRGRERSLVKACAGDSLRLAHADPAQWQVRYDLQLSDAGQWRGMLRLACCFAVDRNIPIIGPMHDAVLIEGPAADIKDIAPTGCVSAETGSNVWQAMGGDRLRRRGCSAHDRSVASSNPAICSRPSISTR